VAEFESLFAFNIVINTCAAKTGGYVIAIAYVLSICWFVCLLARLHEKLLSLYSHNALFTAMKRIQLHTFCSGRFI